MQGTVFQLIVSAGLLVKLVLLTLAFFSTFSWTIILYKYFALKGAAKDSETFIKAFETNRELKTLSNVANTLPRSPLANVFKAILPEQSHLHRDELRRTLRRYEAREEAKLYANLTFLATTGSTTPFIGLFGTVWGIMNAFRAIGATGSASLAIVAPGIAEALITTAAGLVAAIPAVIAYNYYLSRARSLTAEMEDFSEELLALFAKRVE